MSEHPQTAFQFGATQLAAFARDGFIVVRAVADTQRIAHMRAIVEKQMAEAAPPVELEADLHYPGAPASQDAPGGKTTRRLLQAYCRHPVFGEWASDPAVVEIVRQLLGPAVMLSQAHHNCIMTKQPRYSSATGWHQDIRYWRYEKPELVSVWLALGTERPENGCLSFIPGSHRLDVARSYFDDAMFLREDVDNNRALLSSCVTPRLEAGDALFFHCRTFHAAGSNRTDSPKVSLVFTYHTGDNRAIPGTRSASLPSIALNA